MKKSKSKYITGRDIKDVTILTNFILKFLERIDAYKGEDVLLQVQKALIQVMDD